MRHANPRPRTLALITTGLLTLIGAGGATAYLTFDSNVTSAPVETLLVERTRPPAPTPDPTDPSAGVPVNILLLGSDARDGANAELGGEEEGMRSDTTLLAHISADRTSVTLVSIPRDSLVQMPECVTTNGTLPATYAMFNSAFARGYDHGGDITSAASCTMSTVESLTGIRLDGFISVDFAGFAGIVDALGGVPITIDEPIISPKAGLNLPAGDHVLSGTQALGIARARTGEGLTGSDLDRIDRQHDLLAATTEHVLSQNLLSDTPALLRFLGAATRSLTASESFDDLPELSGLAFSLRGIDPAAVTFETVPTEPAPNPNRVVWTPDAAALWADVAAR